MIGDKIKQRRLELGMTQEELAHKIGCKSKSAINKIEKNINDVNQSKLIKLADALDCSPTFFIEDISVGSFQSEIIQAYADKLSKLSPEKQNNVMKYIDFLEREETE